MIGKSFPIVIAIFVLFGRTFSLHTNFNVNKLKGVAQSIKFHRQLNYKDATKKYSRLHASSDNATSKNLFSYSLSSFFIIIGANFLGVTSLALSSFNPEYFRSTGIDEIYPIQGYQRYVDRNEKFEFIYPYNWSQDRKVLAAKADENSLPRELKQKKLSSSLQVAFGPNGNDGDFKENVSVAVNYILPGFSLQDTLGNPKESAEKLLKDMAARANDGRTFTLIKAEERQDGNQRSYQYEYIAQNDIKKFKQHTISVVTNRGTQLFTLTATVPENRWLKEKEKLETVANSFSVKPLEIAEGFY